MLKRSLPELLLLIIFPLLLYEGSFFALNVCVHTLSSAPESNTVSVIVQCLAAAVTISVIGPLYLRERKRAAKKQAESLSLSRLLLTALSGIFTGLAGNLLINLTGLPASSDAFRAAGGMYMEIPWSLKLAGLVLILPLCEELIYRGMVFTAVRQQYGFMAAAFISALIFAIVHMNPVQGLYALVTGFLFAALFEHGGRLLLPYTAHAFCNLTAISLPQLLPEDVSRQALAAAGVCALAGALITVRRCLRRAG